MVKILLILFLVLTGCNANTNNEAVQIQLSDEKILVDGIQINSESEDIYVKRDIVYRKLQEYSHLQEKRGYFYKWEMNWQRL